MGNDAVTGIITHFSERHSPAKNASENMPFRRRGNAQPSRLRRYGLDVGGGFPRAVNVAFRFTSAFPGTTHQNSTKSPSPGVFFAYKVPCFMR